MDFCWSEEQLAFKKAVVEFARKELDDDLILRDKDGIFSAGSGRSELTLEYRIPGKYSGQGVDMLTTILVMEELGYGCKSTA